MTRGHDRLVDAQEVHVVPQGPQSLHGPQPRHGDWADDGDLAEEIQLYGDLVVAASESERPLTPAEIDCALGLAGERAARSAARA